MKAEYVIGALVALWLADWTRRAYRAAFFQRVCDNCGGTVHGVIGGPDLCFNCKKTAWDAGWHYERRATVRGLAKGAYRWYRYGGSEGVSTDT